MRNGSRASRAEGPRPDDDTGNQLRDPTARAASVIPFVLKNGPREAGAATLTDLAREHTEWATGRGARRGTGADTGSADHAGPEGGTG